MAEETLMEMEDFPQEDLPQEEKPPQEQEELQEEQEVVQEESKEAQEEEVQEEEPSFPSLKIKYKGKEIPIENEDEAIALMQKGFDYEVKMSKIKPFTKIAKVVQQEELSFEDIKALADAKKGKREALDYLAEKFSLKREDTFDLPQEESGYKPQIEESNPIQETLEDVMETSPNLYGKVVEILKEIPPTFQREISTPELFPAFIKSVEVGEFDKVYPIAMKIKAVNPALGWVQAYQAAAQGVVQEQQKQEPPQQKQKVRKARKETPKEEDYWEKDLEELERIVFS